MNNDENHQIEQFRGQFLVYQAENGSMKLDVRLQDETIWLSINQMAELFGRKPRKPGQTTINRKQTGTLLLYSFNTLNLKDLEKANYLLSL